MKCPNCNRELKEGQLYCEVCGEEIKMVPEFEPEIENSIEETLLGLADIINEEDDVVKSKSVVSKADKKESFSIFTKENKKNKDDFLIEDFPDDEELLDGIKDDDLSDENFWDEEEIIAFKGDSNIAKVFKAFWSRSFLSKMIVLLSSVLIIVVLVMATMAISRTLRENSYPYQVNQALEAAEAKDYNSAITYMEKALTMDSSDIEMKYLLAGYYDQIGESDNAILVLKGLICGDTETDINTYTKMFDIYSREGNIVEISRTLSECEDSVILEQFRQYVANTPEFSEPGGSYDDVVHLKLTSNTTGTIYYTVNGGTPDTSSEVYTSPIFLESGYYTVKAIFVNSYGLVSDIISQQYEIKVTVPVKPVINVPSGTYDVPQLITVEVPEGCTTYYTTDGSIPTRDSIQYKEPICMPLGDSKFTFVTYSAENVASEPSMAMYTFKIPADATVTMSDAACLVTVHRFNMGGLMDTQGHLSTISGKLLYMCEAAVTLEDDIYYVVYEYYEDPNSLLRTKTGLMFCMAMHDNTKIGVLEIDTEGNYYRVINETIPQ